MKIIISIEAKRHDSVVTAKCFTNGASLGSRLSSVSISINQDTQSDLKIQVRIKLLFYR